MPANSAGAGSQKRVTGTRGRIPLAGLVLAALPARSPRVYRLSPVAVPPVISGVSGATNDHAPGRRRGQAHTGLTARRGTAGRWAPFKRIGRSSSPPPRGIARSEAPASPTGVSSVRLSRAEPSGVAGGCQSLHQPPVFGARRQKEAGSRDGTGQVNGRTTMKAGRLPSGLCREATTRQRSGL